VLRQDQGVLTTGGWDVWNLKLGHHTHYVRMEKEKEGDAGEIQTKNPEITQIGEAKYGGTYNYPARIQFIQDKEEGPRRPGGGSFTGKGVLRAEGKPYAPEQFPHISASKDF